MQKWEYLILVYSSTGKCLYKTKNEEIEIKLQKGQSFHDYIFSAGEEGWELVSTSQTSSEVYGSTSYYFKRPIE